MKHTSQILMTEFVTHDVRRFVLEKPEGFEFEPGQAVELALDRDGWREEGRPFTPTSLPTDRVLELTIKGYPEHDGVTTRLHELGPGDRVLFSDAFGTITYRGRGTFIAGGAGITPFLAIVRDRVRKESLDDHRLLFSNKTPADVICEKELRHAFGKRCFLTCTRESAPGYDDRLIDGRLLEELVDDFDQRFYVCGPPEMVDDLTEALEELGAEPDGIVLEG